MFCSDHILLSQVQTLDLTMANNVAVGHWAKLAFVTAKPAKVESYATSRAVKRSSAISEC